MDSSVNKPASPDPVDNLLFNMLRRALGDQLDPAATSFLEAMAQDAVMEFPYAPPGVVRRLHGRPALAQHLKNVSGVLEFGQLTDPVVHRSHKDGVFVLEFSCIGRAVTSGAPYNQDYISVITLRDGLIQHYRDYWNPLTVLDALRGVKPLAPHILLTGGSGKTASRVATQLDALGIHPRIGSRSARLLDGVIFDWYEPRTFAAALEGIRAVYLVAPSDTTEPLRAMLPFLELALSSGVERFVLLSASSLEEGGPMMGAVHAWLRAHAPQWIVLRPTWFMQNFSELQHLHTIRRDNAIYSATGSGRVGFIDAQDIAAVAVRALTQPDFPNGDQILTGPEALSYDAVAEHISTVCGRTIEHRHVDEAALAERMVASGMEPGYAQILAAMDTAIANGAEQRLSDSVLALTGRAPRQFADFAAGQAAAWARS